MVKRGALIIAIIILLIAKLSAQQNFIAGRVLDARTKEPLTGVNIIVNELKGIGGASEINGVFNIKVPSGSYSISASYIGYRPVIKTDIVVTSGSEAHTVIYMEEVSLELNQVVIKSDYFDKATKDNNISTISLGAEEIKRSPGSAQDFLRILQGMAGVSFANDQKNELMVRGGSPNENLIVFDNMEIHSTNHFPSDYNSSGRINMVNLDLIEDIQFSTGGFSSKFGDKLSSVICINNREGSRNYNLCGNVNLSMQGFGSVLEGKISEGKGSWIFSVRKSFLDLIKSSLGLSTVPEYWDTQFKVSYDLSPVHKLSCTGLYGHDEVYDDGFNDEEIPEKANSVDSTGRSKSDIKQTQLALGLNFKSIWSKNLYSLFTLYYSSFRTKNHTSEDFVQRTFNSSGEEIKTNTLNQRPISIDNHDNGQIALNSEFIWNINKSNELNFGARISSNKFNQDIYLAGDSVRYKSENSWLTVKEAPSNQLYSINLFDNYKVGTYVNHKFSLAENMLQLNLGIRYDYFSYSSMGNLSPRFSASFYLIPDITSLNFSYGEYYQTQLFPVYSDREHTDINRYLKNTHARHFVVGFEQILDEGLKLSIEGYYKNYNDIPVSERFVNFYNRTNRSNRKVNVGKQDVLGADLLLQQKFVKDIYGTFAWSVMESKVKDPRIGKEGNEYPSDFDFPNVVTLIVGKRLSGLRNEIDKMPWYLRYLNYILPVSNEMEISLRWRYATGKSYTPNIFVKDEQFYEGETRWSRGTWTDSENINSARYPDYHRLDVSFISRFNFYKGNLTLYLTLENLYNRKNIAGYEYNSDGTIDKVKQFSLFPVAGIEWEF